MRVSDAFTNNTQVPEPIIQEFTTLAEEEQEIFSGEVATGIGKKGTSPSTHFNCLGT